MNANDISILVYESSRAETWYDKVHIYTFKNKQNVSKLIDEESAINKYSVQKKWGNKLVCQGNLL